MSLFAQGATVLMVLFHVSRPPSKQMVFNNFHCKYYQSTTRPGGVVDNQRKRLGFVLVQPVMILLAIQGIKTISPSCCMGNLGFPLPIVSELSVYISIRRSKILMDFNKCLCGYSTGNLFIL